MDVLRASAASVDELLPGTRQANAELVRSMMCLSEGARAIAPDGDVSIGISCVSASLTSVATSCRSRFNEIDAVLADHSAKFEALGSQIAAQQKKIEGMAFPALSILYGEVAGDLRKYCARRMRGKFGDDFHFKVTADHCQALGIPPALYSKLLDSRVPFAHPYIGDLEIVAHLAPIAKTLYPDEHEEHWELLMALDAARRMYGPVPTSGTMRIDPRSLALPDRSSLSIDEKTRLNALLGHGSAMPPAAAVTTYRAAASISSVTPVVADGGAAGSAAAAAAAATAAAAAAADEIAAQTLRKQLAAEKLARLKVANEPRLLELAAGGGRAPTSFGDTRRQCGSTMPLGPSGPASSPGMPAFTPASFKSAASASRGRLDSGLPEEPASTSTTGQAQAGKRSRAAYSAQEAFPASGPLATE